MSLLKCDASLEQNATTEQNVIELAHGIDRTGNSNGNTQVVAKHPREMLENKKCPCAAQDTWDEILFR